MGTDWHRVGGRAWWAAAVLAFLALELALRVKLGSIYVLAAAWALAHQDLAGRMGHPLPRPGQSDQLLYAMLAAFAAAAFIFAVFTVLTISVRLIDNDIRWFQLP